MDLLLEHEGLWRMSDAARVEWFARVNGMDLERARQEFCWDADGSLVESMAHRRGPFEQSFEAGLDEWAREHGVRVFALGIPPVAGAGAMVADRFAGYAATIAQAYDKKRREEVVGAVVGSVSDPSVYGGHARCFHVRGSTATSGALFASRLSRVDAADVLRLAAALRSVGLSFRLGLGEDAWFSRELVPLVVWNPELVQLSMRGKDDQAHLWAGTEGS